MVGNEGGGRTSETTLPERVWVLLKTGNRWRGDSTGENPREECGGEKDFAIFCLNRPFFLR